MRIRRLKQDRPCKYKVNLKKIIKKRKEKTNSKQLETLKTQFINEMKELLKPNYDKIFCRPICNTHTLIQHV